MTRPGCPICGKPAETRYRPFCSKRCADVDLQRWFAGSYVLDADAPTEDGGGRVDRLDSGTGED